MGISYKAQTLNDILSLQHPSLEKAAGSPSTLVPPACYPCPASLRDRPLEPSQGFERIGKRDEERGWRSGRDGLIGFTQNQELNREDQDRRDHEHHQE